MNLLVRYLPEFIDDFNRFSEHDKAVIRTAIDKLCKNPYSKKDGGYGNPVIGNADNGIMSVKIIFTDIRIVYKLMQSKGSQLLIFAEVSNDNSRRKL